MQAGGGLLGGDRALRSRGVPLAGQGPATCPLDTILLEAVAERVSLLEAGRSPEEVLGPEYPNFTILMNPEARAHSHPISQLLTDILRTFPDISRLPEQVGYIPPHGTATT